MEMQGWVFKVMVGNVEADRQIIWRSDLVPDYATAEIRIRMFYEDDPEVAIENVGVIVPISREMSAIQMYP